MNLGADFQDHAHDHSTLSRTARIVLKKDCRETRAGIHTEFRKAKREDPFSTVPKPHLAIMAQILEAHCNAAICCLIFWL